MWHTISECWLIIEFIKDILTDWNDAAANRSNHEGQAHFGKIVQLHSNIKELSETKPCFDFFNLSFERMALKHFCYFCSIGA